MMISNIFGFLFRIIVLEPMVLIGILICGTGWYYVGLDTFLQFAKLPVVYAVLFGIAFLYAIFFKHVYKINTNKIDWWATFISSFTHFFTILLAIAFTYLIIFACNYGFGEKLDKYLRDK